MKLDSLFKVQENKLYKIADNSYVDLSCIKTLAAENAVQTEDYFIRLEVKWSSVELADEEYNEEFLANLRDFLKNKEEAKRFAVITPVIDRPLSNPDQQELFINAFNHTARRIKDCVSVAGMELPLEMAETGTEQFALDFMEKLAIKHAQYVYFSKSEKLQNSAIVKY